MARTSGSKTPPLSPYGTFDGCSLFQYHENLVAVEAYSPHFSSSSELPPNKLILIGGLSDGLFPVPYTQSLLEQLPATWSLVQPLTSSSYLGFGHGSLQRDTQQLQALFSYLMAHRQAKQFAWVGHSTGCQNAVHFVKHASLEIRQHLKLVVLQAPVSDREHAMMEVEQYESNVETARRIVASNKESEEMMPRSAFWAPITARRFLDLQDVGGADDFFSSDFSDEQLCARLQHVGTSHENLKVLVAFSGSDEYVPPSVDSPLLLERLVRAMNSGATTGEVAVPLYLPTANHNLSESERDAKVFVEKVIELLEKIPNA